MPRGASQHDSRRSSRIDSDVDRRKSPPKRKNHFGDSFASAGGPSCSRLKAPLGGPQEERDETPKAQLLLGCFERPEPKTKAAKRRTCRPFTAELHIPTPTTAAVAETVSKDALGSGTVDPKPTDPTSNTSLHEQLEGMIYKHSSAALPSELEREHVRETSGNDERREREYFKPFLGEPCGPGNRFLVEAELGRGSFSTVCRCKDVKSEGREYAIKFIRSNVTLLKVTEREIKLMRRLRSQVSEKDPEGASCLLALAGPETFEHNGHAALVFHLQRCDTKTYMQRYQQGRGFLLQDVQRYARNIFLALRALRSARVIHFDLKPANLLLSLDKSSVKLCDFGCAVELAEQDRVSYVRPTYCSFYRAPEIILGQSYSTRVDMWSAGATIFELCTGRTLFAGKTNNAMLYEMLVIIGPFPKSFATSGKFATKHFNGKGDFKWKEEGEEAEMSMARFPDPATPTLRLLEDSLPLPSRGVGNADRHRASTRHLAALLAACLRPDPAGRAAPEAGLRQRFLRDDGAQTEPPPATGRRGLRPSSCGEPPAATGRRGLRPSPCGEDDVIVID